MGVADVRETAEAWRGGDTLNTWLRRVASDFLESDNPGQGRVHVIGKDPALEIQVSSGFRDKGTEGRAT